MHEEVLISNPPTSWRNAQRPASDVRTVSSRVHPFPSSHSEFSVHSKTKQSWNKFWRVDKRRLLLEKWVENGSCWHSHRFWYLLSYSHWGESWGDGNRAGGRGPVFVWSFQRFYIRKTQISLSDARKITSEKSRFHVKHFWLKRAFNRKDFFY